MKINLTKNEIVVTKSEYTKAMKVGTPEFEELFRVKQMLPNANIVIKKPASKQNYKRLTKEFMLKFVNSNDEKYSEEFNKLFDLIGTTFIDKNDGECKEVSFFYIRRVFLEKYPQFMTKSDREKYEESKKSKESEENTNIVEMSMAG